MSILCSVYKHGPIKTKHVWGSWEEFGEVGGSWGEFGGSWEELGDV